MHSNFDCICNYIPKDYLKDKLYVITGNVSHINSREDRIMLTYFLTPFSENYSDFIIIILTKQFL